MAVGTVSSGSSRRNVRRVGGTPGGPPIHFGTVRREYLDQVPFWGARDLERKLMSFQDYYNKDCVYRALDGARPNEHSGITDRKPTRLDDCRWEKRCCGLYQLPVAA